MSQRKLDTFFKLKSDTQQPTPDKDKGDRDKTYLCSTMKNECLSSIGILHIHQSKSVNFEGIIDEFAGAANRRLAFPD
jgi:hypothetical protein